MKSDLEKAKALLRNGKYTCVICSGDNIYTSTERGVKPLLAWTDSKTDMKGFSAADKVIGKAAAFLYVILGVDSVYADIISEPAKAIFEEKGIALEYGLLVQAIKNRSGTGFCPMETAVKSIFEPSAALEAIRKKAAELAENPSPGNSLSDTSRNNQ